MLIVKGITHSNGIFVHKSLAWQRIGVEEALARIKMGLDGYLQTLPESNMRSLEKCERWMEMVTSIEAAIVKIRSEVLPAVESDLGYALIHPEMVIISMIQPSTRNLFLEIEIHFHDIPGFPLSSGKLEKLACMPDAAATLAWIGDAALKIGVLPEIWTSDIAEAGVLTERRKEYEKNANMAKLCDRWGLYSHRIHFDPDVVKGEIAHVKGTLVESIYGIIFLQGGLKAVAEAAALLTPQATGN